jgi:hypothetical protein
MECGYILFALLLSPVLSQAAGGVDMEKLHCLQNCSNLKMERGLRNFMVTQDQRYFICKTDFSLVYMDANGDEVCVEVVELGAVDRVVQKHRTSCIGADAIKSMAEVGFPIFSE